MNRQHLQFIKTWTVNKQWLIVYLYHIRMDTPEPQKQFGLWWECHSISRLQSLIQRDSNSKCRNNILVLTKNNTKHWCKCFGKFSNKLWKQYPSINLNQQHLKIHSRSLHNDPMPEEVLPPQILLRGNDPNCSVHPRPPSPPGAAPPRRRGRSRLPCAAVFRLGSPRTRGGSRRAEPKRNEGEKKFWENFGYLKSRSFGNCGHSKSSLHLTNTVVLRCPGDIVLVPKNCFLWCSIEAVSAMFAINMDLEKLKHTPSLENKYAQDWDTTEFENNPLFSTCFVS